MIRMCTVKFRDVVVDLMLMEQRRVVVGMREDLPVAGELAAHCFVSLGEKLSGGFAVKADVDLARTLVDAELFDIEFPRKKARDTGFNAARALQVWLGLQANSLADNGQQ